MVGGWGPQSCRGLTVCPLLGMPSVGIQYQLRGESLYSFGQLNVVQFALVYSMYSHFPLVSTLYFQLEYSRISHAPPGAEHANNTKYDFVLKTNQQA
jgi:hypothetical protein